MGSQNRANLVENSCQPRFNNNIGLGGFDRVKVNDTILLSSRMNGPLYRGKLVFTRYIGI